MSETTMRDQATVVTAAGVVVLLETITFLIAALLHLGIPLPLRFSEPIDPPAFIVESFIALSLVVSTFSLFACRQWAWHMTLGAHLFTAAGVLLGIVASTMGPGTDTVANAIYHRVMLGVAAAAVLLLLTPQGRKALGAR